MSLQRQPLAGFPLVRGCAAFVLLLAVFALSLSAANESTGKPRTNAEASNLLRSLAYFEQNEGQVDTQALYLTQGLGYTAYLTRDGATLVFPSASKSLQGRGAVREKVVRLNIVGIDPNAEILGVEKRIGESNYFSGVDPQQWHTHISQFAKVLYRNAYPGIDLLFEIRDGRLEYDFLVSPHANTDVIRVNVEGASPRRTANGDVVVRFGQREVFELKKPNASQPGREDRPTEVRYALHGREMAFALAQYDHNLPLVIDPALIFSTYLVSNCPNDCTDGVTDMTADSTGVYVSGVTNAASFPAPGGSKPVTGNYSRGFVTKLDPQGTTVIYTAFIASSFTQAIAVDASQSVYVTGIASYPPPSGEATFPITPGAFSSPPAGVCSGSSYGCGAPFASKISPDGATLQYSTLLQLAAGNGQDGTGVYMYPWKVAVDSSGALYVTGYTSNAISLAPLPFGPFPTTVGAYQTFLPASTSYGGFVMKLNPTGSGTSYATYLSGPANVQGNTDGFQISRVAVDSSGSAYVAGTYLAGWPTTPGAYETADPNTTGFTNGFVTKMSPSGSSLAYSTYIGGVENNQILDMAVDANGEATVVGYGFTPPSLPSGCASNTTGMFVTRLNAAGSALAYSTTFCSDLGEFTGIALDGTGAAFVNGFVDTDVPTFFPMVNPIQGIALPLTGDAGVVAKFDTSGNLAWSTYFGVASRIAVDPADNIYLLNAGPPTTANALEPQSGLPPNHVAPTLARIAPSLGAPVAVVSPSTVAFGNEPVGVPSSAVDVSIANYGDANLSATISITGDFSQTNTCASPVPGGQKCDVNVVFTPTVAGNRTGTLTVNSGGPTAQVIPLAGTGTAPAVGFTPPVLNFEPQIVGTTSLAQQVLVNNGGTGPLSITSLQITGDFAQSNTCGSPVAVGSSCTVQITFSPTALGARTGVLTIVDNAPGSPHTLSISGQGTSQQASLNPTSLTFVSQLVGATSGAATVVLHNAGTSALAISSISATGDFAATNNCGASLAAGMDCQITVSFTPTASGTRTGNIVVADSSTGSPQMVSLSGVGTDFSLAVGNGGSTSATITAGQPVTYNLQMSPADFTGTITLTCKGAPAQSTCLPSPAALNVSGSSPTSFKVNVTTTAASVGPPLAFRDFPRRTPLWPAAMNFWLMLTALLLGGTALAKRRRHVHVWAVSLILLVSVAAMLTACGGGSGGTTTPPPTSGGTPAGTYTLVVTGKSGTLSHSVNLTLIVN